ncbi:MAG: hypothetical protein C5B56_13360 [Proteobacteria bacterium]|nr:MAG: hypothetical protein C5B56_13360 [Pseudomonadota bacterium]
MRRFSIFALAAACLLLAAGSSHPARAADQAWADCEQEKDWDRSIAGCTTVLGRARESVQNRTMAFYNRGISYQAKGDHDRAIADFDQALKLRPNEPDALVNRGRSYEAKGDHDRAITDYEQVLKVRPGNLDALFNRGLSYEAKGDHDRAIADYDQVLKARPNDQDALYQRGASYLEKKNYDRGIADLDRLIRLKPNDKDGLLLRGMAFLLRGHAHEAAGERSVSDYDRALADFDRVIKLDPKSAVAYHGRGNASFFKLDYERALADYNRANQLDPKLAGALDSRGNVHMAKGDLAAAIADFDAAILVDPKEGSPFNNRGYARLQLGKTDEALADLNEAIRLMPKEPEPYYHRAAIWAAKGDLERARADYKAAIAGSTEDLDGLRAQKAAQRRLADLDRGELPPRPEPNRSPRDEVPQPAPVSPPPPSRTEAPAPAPAATKPAGLTSGPATSPARPSPAAVKPAAIPPSPATSPAPTAPTTKETRIALVIGNGRYENMAKLPNPPNDAADLAAVLKSLGFAVTLGLDLKRGQMEDTLIAFTKAARNADTALVFYAGHGLQHQGTNYLAPVDARITDEADLQKLIKVQDMIANLQTAKNVRILILDACRDNDVIRELASAKRGIRRGLAAEKAEGILIAFATQANQSALDGDGRNSPFTAALLKNLPKPGVELRTMLTMVRSDVLATTGREQRPEVSDSLDGLVVLNPQ